MNLNGTQVQFLGSEKGNGTTLTRLQNTSGVDMHPVSRSQAKSKTNMLPFHLNVNRYIIKLNMQIFVQFYL